ncbi:MAG: xanthine dehydrogenase accessory protein XdhC [Devosia sp.]|uniref:xanthine dehydrogenase accessory protein XdhC n=1 Tax=Devosia sp. 66-22 TaxID=1895753 RepID=UPI0009285055|nr:xanthine dehydrogenase accessory protein XdhC [Devosia sp. 66-22]MBN9346735.1 xanthine dehydrogenase accessory protein XdhC [Devosia sp.]OJX51947.1 MAG: xanthine dehydrogenase accessory protein XdhC [Devosia sp. 66-22]
MRSADLDAFLSDHPAAIVAELTSVRGSSPREQGAFMLIAAAALLGTIGGGALEYMVIARARQALRDGLPPGVMEVPLGPEIGQCCGGRVTVALRVVGASDAARLASRLRISEGALPHVYLFGSGHVGKALARALAALPLQVHVIDTRPDELHDLPAGVEARAVPMPEAVVRTAPAGAAFVILTHDHALDFLIAAEALKRADAPYVGMVGSRTKRARFASWYHGGGGAKRDLARLVLPIGDFGLVDKRPEVIAALAAAEIMVHIGSGEASGTRPVATMSGAAID